jgi:hypothetical protein
MIRVRYTPRTMPSKTARNVGRKRQRAGTSARWVAMEHEKEERELS